jgi:hypothetical protein
MTIWYWGNGEEFEHYFPKPRVPKKAKKHTEDYEQKYAEIEAELREALEWIALSHPTSLKKLMEAPEGTPTIKQRGKRKTSEPRSDYDSWKPNYHIDD